MAVLYFIAFAYFGLSLWLLGTEEVKPQRVAILSLRGKVFLSLSSLGAAILFWHFGTGGSHRGLIFLALGVSCLLLLVFRTGVDGYRFTKPFSYSQLEKASFLLGSATLVLVTYFVPDVFYYVFYPLSGAMGLLAWRRNPNF